MEEVKNIQDLRRVSDGPDFSPGRIFFPKPKNILTVSRNFRICRDIVHCCEECVRLPSSIKTFLEGRLDICVRNFDLISSTLCEGKDEPTHCVAIASLRVSIGLSERVLLLDEHELFVTCELHAVCRE